MFTYTNPAPTNVAILHELGIPWFAASGRAAKAVARLARAGGAEL
jgi:hypothetical protein